MTGLTAFLIVAFGAASVYAADIDAGKQVFNRCKICHTIVAGAPSTVGPNLHGLFGRKAGALPGYAYSQVLRNAEITWDTKTLTAYLHDPKTDLPGNRMGFPGISSDTDLADLIAYLKRATR